MYYSDKPTVLPNHTIESRNQQYITLHNRPLQVFSSDEDELEESLVLSVRKDAEKRMRSVYGPDGTPARLQTFSGISTPAKRRQQRQLAMEMDEAVNMATNEVVLLYQKSIQLCTTNKINSTNAWELGLIDHIERAIDPSNTGEINFQRAGSAIDASCKIFSARVDNVHKTVYKVLDDLTRNRNHKKGKDDDHSDEEGVGLAKNHKDKKQRSKRTLEKDIHKITLDVLETEVDPMFRQTSAAFDEGGARGLLINHLGLKTGGEIVFDLSSVMVNALESDKKIVPEYDADTVTRIDWYDYRLRVMPTLNATELASICNSLAKFNFKEDAGEDSFPCFEETSDNMATETFNIENLDLNMDDGRDCHDNGADDIDDQYDDMPNMWETANEAPQSQLGAFSSTSVLNAVMQDGLEGDVSFKEGHSIHAEHQVGDVLVALAHQPQDDYAFFPNTRSNNWAGPDHWLKSSVKALHSRGATGESRRPKPPFRIDFTQPCRVDWDKALSCSKSTTTLTHATLEKLSEDKTTLPEDVHYRPDELRRLFLKTDCMIVRRRQAVADDQVLGVTQMVYDYDNNRDNDYCGDLGEQGNDYDDNDGIMDGDDHHADVFDSEINAGKWTTELPKFDLYGEELDLVDPPKIVGRINIGYARTAKQVDVRKLKTQMWQEIMIDTKIGEDKENGPTKTIENDDEISFKEICHRVQKTLPEQKSKDVSVALSFVCLLHLANEKSLEIKQGDMDKDVHGMNDLQIRKAMAA
eukprot:CFRG5223T1